MIPKKAIKTFLEWERDSFIWMKELSEEDVDRAIAKLRPRPRFSTVLDHHQKICFLLGIAYKAFGYWLDMGLGKTLISLELIRYWYEAEMLDRALVFCRTNLAVDGWVEEMDKWKVRLPTLVLDMQSSKEKWRALDEFDSGLVLLTYDGATAMCSDRKTVVKRGKIVYRKNGEPKVALKLNRKLVRRLGSGVGAYVCDESTEVGSKHSLAWRMCNMLAKTVDYRYLLAGRPFGRNPSPLWAQCYLLDKGEALGNTLEIFHEALFKKLKSKWAYLGFEYKFDKANEPKLARLIQHRSISYESRECHDLPQLIIVPKAVSLPEEAGLYYERMVAKVIEARGNLSEMQNLFCRMRQLSSGFIGFRDDDTGARAEIEFEENPKLDLLEDLIYKKPHGRKGLIFHEFRWSGKRIQKMLDEVGVGYGRIQSGMENYREMKRAFDHSKGMDWLIVPNKMGAYSLNLQAANYEFVFESPVSPIDREQLERRIQRRGQEYICFLYDLIVRGTMDERILLFHKEGNDLFKALVRDPAKVLQFRPRPRLRGELARAA